MVARWFSASRPNRRSMTAIIPLAAEVRGWNIMQSHFLGQDLRDVWLAH